MLEAKDVTIVDGESVLVEHLSFVAKPGEVTFLDGVAAASSVIVARALLGLWPVSNGYVTLCGEVVTPRSASWLRRMMAYVPQSLPDGFGDGPVTLSSVEEALSQVDVQTKRVVVVERADETAMAELQNLADSGLAVVVVNSWC